MVLYMGKSRKQHKKTFSVENSNRKSEGSEVTKKELKETEHHHRETKKILAVNF